MKRPTISVIVPIFNAEKYLPRCLESILNQTFKDIEIICVNDGSTDKSLKIIKKYARRDNRIKIIDKANGGVINARITGYNEASGEYIGWVDSDDFIESKMYEKMIKSANKRKADVVYCDYNFYPDKITRRHRWFKPYNGIMNWEMILENTQQWNKLVKKDLLDKLNIAHLFEYIGEGCYGIVLINSKSTASISDRLYNYRIGHVSTSNNHNNTNWYKAVVKKAKNNLDYVRKRKYSQEWIDYYKYRFLYYNLILALISARNSQKETYRRAISTAKREKLFSQKYYRFTKSHISSSKLIFLRCFAHVNYTMARVLARTVLR